MRVSPGYVAPEHVGGTIVAELEAIAIARVTCDRAPRGRSKLRRQTIVERLALDDRDAVGRFPKIVAVVGVVVSPIANAYFSGPTCRNLAIKPSAFCPGGEPLDARLY